MTYTPLSPRIAQEILYPFTPKKNKIMAQLLIHEKLRLLHQESDKNLKITQPTENPFKFAAQINSIVLAGAEFGEASKSMPIFFVASQDGPIRPVGLLGLKSETNLFVDEGGKWEERAYVPAFFRRYPFVFNRQEKDSQFQLCIDDAFEGWSREEGTPLFDEDGSYSDYLKGVLQFMGDYENSMSQTETFSIRLKEWGLLGEVEVSYTDPTAPDVKNKLNGLMKIDEEKFLALKPEQLSEIHRAGTLSWIYAHLNSISNISALAGRIR